MSLTTRILLLVLLALAPALPSDAPPSGGRVEVGGVAGTGVVVGLGVGT